MALEDPGAAKGCGRSPDEPLAAIHALGHERFFWVFLAGDVHPDSTPFRTFTRAANAPRRK